MSSMEKLEYSEVIPRGRLIMIDRQFPALELEYPLHRDGTPSELTSLRLHISYRTTTVGPLCGHIWVLFQVRLCCPYC